MGERVFKTEEQKKALLLVGLPNSTIWKNENDPIYTVSAKIIGRFRGSYYWRTVGRGDTVEKALAQAMEFGRTGKEMMHLRKMEEVKNMTRMEYCEKCGDRVGCNPDGVAVGCRRCYHINDKRGRLGRGGKGGHNATYLPQARASNNDITFKTADAAKSVGVTMDQFRRLAKGLGLHSVILGIWTGEDVRKVVALAAEKESDIHNFKKRG